jgi:Chemotaxis signal transduction protein
MCSGQYVVFTLDEDEYAVEISFAKEIIRIPKKIYKVPNVPPYLIGMFNLRDTVIPVIDLKKRFNLEQKDIGPDSRLLILELDDKPTGIIVDDVTEVIKLDEKNIEKFSSEMTTMSKDSTYGVSKLNNRLIILLNFNKLSNELFCKNIN